MLNVLFQIQQIPQLLMEPKCVFVYFFVLFLHALLAKYIISVTRFFFVFFCMEKKTWL